MITVVGAVLSFVLAGSERPEHGLRSVCLSGPVHIPDHSMKWFGSSISMDGNMMAVGAQPLFRNEPIASRIFLFRNEGAEWIPETSIAVPPSAEDSLFGKALAIRGSKLLVGAPVTDMRGGAGSAFLFERGEDGSWGLSKSFSGPTDLCSGYGYAVALGDKQLAIGSPWSGTREVVEVYRHSRGEWRLHASLHPSEEVAWQGFGAAVACMAESVAVLAPYARQVEPALRGMYVAIFAQLEDGSMVQQAMLRPRAESGFPLTSLVWSELGLLAGGTAYDRSGKGCGGAVLFTQGVTGWAERWTIQDSGLGECMGLGRLLATSRGAIMLGFSNIAGTSVGGSHAGLAIRLDVSTGILIEQSFLSIKGAIEEPCAIFSVDATSEFIGVGCGAIGPREEGMVLVGAFGEFSSAGRLQILRPGMFGH